MHVFLNCLNPVFLGLVYQKHTLIGTMKHIIVNYDKYSGFWLSCDVCESEIFPIVRKVLTCFTIIILNDYTTVHSDSDTISDTKIDK